MNRLLVTAVCLLVLASCGPGLVALRHSDEPPAAASQSQPARAAEPAADADSASAAAPDAPAPAEAEVADEPDDDPWAQALAGARQQLTELAANDPQRTAPEAAEDPLNLAAQLQAAEELLREDGAEASDWAAAGHLQQVAVRRWVGRRSWDDEIMARLSGPAAEAAQQHLRAGRVLADMHPTPDLPPEDWPDPPAWRVVDAAPLHELRGYYEEAQAAYGPHWSYLAAINLIETRMGRIDGVSSAGALGPMQFMPGTWEMVGSGNVHDNRDAILAAARLLVRNGAPGDMDRAIWHYNNDRRYVAAVKSYAAAMQADPAALRGYYYWQTYVPAPHGQWRLLPIGFDGS